MLDFCPGRTLRCRIFLSFLAALVPVLVLLAVGVELLLVPGVEARARQSLANSTRMLTQSVHGSASVAIRNHLQAIAERNVQIARHHMALVAQGVLSREEAIARLREIFLSQRVGSSGYLYVLDSNGKAVIHPEPDVEGTDNTRFAFVREQMRRQEGYIEYDWQNPDEPSPRPKALYMAYYEPLDWIISASSYRSEFTELLDPNDLRQAVLSVRFGESGYAYVMDQSGEALIHPVLEPPFNVFAQEALPSGFAREMIDHGRGVVEYDWKNPQEDRLRRKIAVYQSLPEFGWVIVSSAYLDEVTQPVRVARAMAYGGMVLLLVGGGTMAYLLSGRLTRPVNAMLRSLDANARSGVHQPLPVDDSREIGRLGRELNAYMDRIDEQSDQLRRERLRYRSLFEASPDAVFLLRGRTLIACNPATAEIFGADGDALIERDLLDLCPPSQPDGRHSSAVAERIVAAAAGGELQVFEWVHQGLDGRLFDAEVRLKPFGSEHGQPLLVAFVRDITERKRAETAIREERDFSRALIDASPAYIAILDLGGRVRQINPAFLRAMGRSATETVGADYLQLAVPPEEHPFLLGTIDALGRAAGQGRSMVRTGTQEVLTRQEANRTIQWSMTWLAGHGDSGPALLLVAVDTTEQQALQQQLNHAQKLEALGRLAGGVAHDFNNMLGGIAGAAELLQLDLPEDPEVRSHVGLIMETVERAAELAGRLLAFSRKAPSVSAPVKLHGLVRDAMRIFRSGLDPKIETELDLRASEHTVVGDASQVQNVLLNLLLNARDAMPDGGQLRVASRNVRLDEKACELSGFDVSPGKFVEVVVADTGVGMSEAVQAQIFDPFFTTKEEGKGTGLGLSSAYGAIKDHGGEIHVQSSPAAGTIFTIRLPVATQPVEAPVEQPGVVRGTGRVLLVDDDEVLRGTGGMLLQQLGYEVILASDGAEALKLYRAGRGQIDAVLLDMIMPGMDGRDTFRAIRAVDPAARVVIASGFSDAQTVEQLQREGLMAFVGKPYRLAELSQVIAKAIAASSVGKTRR